MKRFILFLLTLTFVNIPAIASGDVVLQCSYITQHSDLHIQLEPFTLTAKGKVMSGKSIIGNVSNFDGESDKLDIIFDNGTSIYFDKIKGLSIFSAKVEGEYVYSYGSCLKVK